MKLGWNHFSNQYSHIWWLFEFEWWNFIQFYLLKNIKDMCVRALVSASELHLCYSVHVCVSVNAECVCRRAAAQQVLFYSWWVIPALRLLNLLPCSVYPPQVRDSATVTLSLRRHRRSGSEVFGSTWRGSDRQGDANRAKPSRLWGMWPEVH